MVMLVSSRAASGSTITSFRAISSVIGGIVRSGVIPFRAASGNFTRLPIPSTITTFNNLRGRHMSTTSRSSLCARSSASSKGVYLYSRRLFASSATPPKSGVEKVVRVTRPEPPAEQATANASASAETQLSGLEKFLALKEIPPRGTFSWYVEMVLICTVFAITGSSTMVLVRPAVKDVLGLEGSMKEGPWAYRICSIVIMSPIYSVLLVVVGTVFGRHAYFRHFSVKMLSRFGIPPEMLDKKFHQTAKTFRKY